MPAMSIQIDGVDKLMARLGALQSNAVLRPPMTASVIEIETWMKAYPSRKSRKPEPGKFKSEKQRRYVMAAIRRGEIKIPYVRTGKLGQAWTWKVTESANGLTGVVGNNINYARYVQNVTLQARMHQGNWRTDAQALTRFRPVVLARFKRAIDRAIAQDDYNLQMMYRDW